MNEINIVTAQNVTLRIELASIGDRFIAAFLDFLVKIGLLVGVSVLVSFVKDVGLDWAGILLWILLAITMVFYSMIFEYFMKGQTPGKRMMKIRVARLDGEPVTFGNFLLRWFFRIIDYFPITWPVVGIISIAATEKNQRVGDLVAGTIMVSTKERSKLTDTFYAATEPGYVPQFPMADQLNARQAEIINHVLQIYLNTDKYDLVTLLAGQIRDFLQVSSNFDDLTFLRTILKDYNQSVSSEVNSQASQYNADDHSQWMPKMN